MEQPDSHQDVYLSKACSRIISASLPDPSPFPDLMQLMYFTLKRDIGVIHNAKSGPSTAYTESLPVSNSLPLKSELDELPLPAPVFQLRVE
ncbi:unnamed protein product [Mesocestoides corti]|uniref:Uncharacterized protein n=1 Tax=Mesocestoides corti TaxID=53468 RepID=A0A0R3UH20_MESCO|nr:unnamed protein product [Mesocestoides corti]